MGVAAGEAVVPIFAKMQISANEPCVRCRFGMPVTEARSAKPDEMTCSTAYAPLPCAYELASHARARQLSAVRLLRAYRDRARALLRGGDEQQQRALQRRRDDVRRQDVLSRP